MGRALRNPERSKETRYKLAQNAYFEWLMNEYTDLNDTSFGETYTFIGRVLFDTEFIVVVDRDENRLSNAVYRRRDFKENVSLYPEEISLERRCNVFEIFVELALKLEFELWGMNEFVQDVKECFFLLVCNLGLDKYTDSYILSIKSKRKLEAVYKEIHDIIDFFVMRRYDYNGNGGVFPLREAKYDQRDTELWYQMCGYLLENFNYGA